MIKFQSITTIAMSYSIKSSNIINAQHIKKEKVKKNKNKLNLRKGLTYFDIF